ncbi:MAG: hypothetical protein GF334_01550 [Candidatus Altiarchaeales archaeon]|nr:hypothetical protein [Candidatus Altiarchaeales archaeon]
MGTLECPEGFVLDERLGLCAPENPTIQASYKKPKKSKNKKTSAIDLLRQVRKNAQQKFSGKMEKCIQDVKADLRKDDRLDESTVKSRAIAICRSQLGE